MTLVPGSRLGPYEILAPLGAGGMGEVYRARDARLGRDVAIKILPGVYSKDPDRMRRFEQEARAAAALNHPNILVIHDIGTHEGAPYEVYELLEGSTLRDRLAGGALPPRKAVEIALDVARGLAAAHARGITHRDLKPENLFVTREGRTKILDFGLAKLTRPDEGAAAASQSTAPTRSPDTDPGLVLGTAGYMAPEQVRGEPVDARADLFALGAILYEMLTGQRPFHRATPVETMNAILKEDPPDLAAAPRPIPPALERIVWHCLEKDPAARFQSARDVAFNLEALSGLSEPSESSRRPAPGRRGPRRALLAAGIAGLLLAVFALGRATRPGSGTVPVFHQLTFRKGILYSARFLPLGQSYIYAADWEGSQGDLYMGRIGSPESRSLGMPGMNLLAVSTSGEMALLLNPKRVTNIVMRGTLARAPIGGGAPREVIEDVTSADWSPNGNDLAVCRSSQQSDRIEYPIGKALFETTGWVSHLRVSPDGDRIAFLFHPTRGDDRGRVMVVDRQGKARALTTEWSSEIGLCWSPRGREVWFTAFRAGNERALYAATLSGHVRTVVGIPGGVTIQDIAKDGRVLLTSDDQRAEIYAIADKEDKQRDLTWLDFSVPADISPDGRRVLFTEQGTAAGDLYTCYIRDVDGTPAVRLGQGEALAFSPDARTVLALLYTTPPRLTLLPVGAGTARTLPNPGFERYRDILARWVPDGRTIVFGAGEPAKGSRVYAQDLATGSVHPVTPYGVTDFLLSNAGDSVFAGGTDGKVYAYPVRGGKPREISAKGLQPDDKYIRISSDGETIFGYQEQNRLARFFRLDARTRSRTMVRDLEPLDTAGLLAVRSVVVSPDGRTIAFMAGRFLSRLYVAEGLR